LRVGQERDEVFWPFAHRVFADFPKLEHGLPSILRPGSQVATRQLIQRVGKGASGAAILCVESTTGNLEVLKAVPKSELLTTRRTVAIWKELTFLQQLEHPNVVTLNDAMHAPSHILLFMEFAGDKNLRRHIQDSAGNATIKSKMDIQRQILAGVAYCHGAGVAHRDLKPENVVVKNCDGCSLAVRIVDFGCAIETTTMCVDGVGTIPFIAPEAVQGRYVPACADLWACGVVFLELLCGINKVKHMLGWSQHPNPTEYCEQIESFFAAPDKVQTHIEADLGSVGSKSYPAEANHAVLGMLTPCPRRRWNAVQVEDSLNMWFQSV